MGEHDTKQPIDTAQADPKAGQSENLVSSGGESVNPAEVITSADLTGHGATGKGTISEEVTSEEVTGVEVTSEEVTGVEVTREEVTSEGTTSEGVASERTIGSSTVSGGTTGNDTIHNDPLNSEQPEKTDLPGKHESAGDQEGDEPEREEPESEEQEAEGQDAEKSNVSALADNSTQSVSRSVSRERKRPLPESVRKLGGLVKRAPHEKGGKVKRFSLAGKSLHSESTSFELVACPTCATALEPWQVTCHKCGKVMSHKAVPVVVKASVQKDELEESISSWQQQGADAFEKESYGDAQACFREALRRLKGVPNAAELERSIRISLAKTLEKLEKNAEAVEQYRAVLTLLPAPDDAVMKDLEARIEQLSVVGEEVVVTQPEVKSDFRPLAARDIRFATLYCACCKRVLLESELYGFRMERAKSVRCFCGFDGIPLTKTEQVKVRQTNEMDHARARKSALLQAAAEEIEGGRNKKTAILLAVTLGAFGAHRFYLGEGGIGMYYLLFFWTAVPWLISIFEAVNYSYMSRMTFNLQYNIEAVIRRMPLEEAEQPASPHGDVFSMEITEDPEDFIDEFNRASE